MSQVAVVTGANRGLGKETARQLAQRGIQVVMTSRDRAKGEAACQELKSQGLPVRYTELDVTNPTSIQRLYGYVRENLGRLDILVNNAGILPDSSSEGGNSDPFQGTVDSIRRAMETNVYGPFQLNQTLIPLMRQNGYGRIVHVSSGMGQLSEMEGGFPAYRISKTALNAVTRIFAAETENMNILVNSVCPGWVKTDMGGPNAERSLEEGVDTIVWLATAPDGSPSGGFFRDRERIDW